jgi:hypothetical protein
MDSNNANTADNQIDTIATRPSLWRIQHDAARVDTTGDEGEAISPLTVPVSQADESDIVGLPPESAVDADEIDAGALPDPY